MSDEQGIGLILIGQGLVMLIIILTFVQYRKRSRNSDKTIRTIATIVDYTKSRSNFNSNSNFNSMSNYKPIVRFIDENGEEHEYISNIASNIKQFKVGEETQIFYHRDKPKKFQLKAGFVMKFFGIVFGLFGTALLILGLFLFMGNLN